MSDGTVPPYLLVFCNETLDIPAFRIVHSVANADTDLIYAYGLAVALVSAYSLAFDAERDSVRRTTFATVVIAEELQRRGRNPLQLDLDKVFKECCRRMREGDPYLYQVPLHCLLSARGEIIDAISLLSEVMEHAEAKSDLEQALNATNSLIQQHGVQNGPLQSRTFDA